MTTPTAATIRGWSRINFGDLGYGDDESLQVLVDRVAENVELVTGRPLSSMPDEFDRQVEEVIQLLVEQRAYQSQEDIAETAADFGLIASFTASGYSETRRSLEEIRKSGLLNPNPAIHSLLWGLLTAEKRDEWLGWITGVNAPAFETTEVDWGYWQGSSYVDGGVMPPEYG